MNWRRFPDVEPVCCAVCKRQATGLGWAGQRGSPVAWLCDNPDCKTLGKKVYEMRPKVLSQVEAFSLNDAGEKAGAYLESIGKFSLSDLTEEEWAAFLKTILTSYEEAMRSRLLSQVAPY